MFVHWPQSTSPSPAAYETIDPQIVRAGIFRPGLAVVVREAEVQPGTHTFRLKKVPLAFENTLWFDSPDGAVVSDILTHLKVETKTTTTNATSILEYLSNNAGKLVGFDYSPYPNTTTVHVEGKLLQCAVENGQLSAEVKSGDTLSAYPLTGIRKLRLTGLKDAVETKTAGPLVDVVFKVRADHAEHIRIRSLEAGAAWNSSYMVELGAGNAKVTSKAQIAMAGLRMTNTDVELVDGIPDFSQSKRLDLTTGLTSLTDWLGQRTVPSANIPIDDEDPYQALARFVETAYSSNGGFGGGGAGGGMGGPFYQRGAINAVSGNIDQTLAAPANFNLQTARDSRATEDERIRFVERVISANRLESNYTYPFGHIDLEPGERITRNLSTIDTSAKSKFDWSVNILPGVNEDLGIRQVLLVKNSSTAPWPSGPIYLTKNDIPIVETIMPFTSAGDTAEVVIGSPSDIVTAHSFKEVSRSQIDDNGPYTVLQNNDAELSIKNPRLDNLSIDITFSLIGVVTDGGGGEVVRNATQSDWANPKSVVTWHLTLEPNQTKVLHAKYSVKI